MRYGNSLLTKETPMKLFICLLFLFFSTLAEKMDGTWTTDCLNGNKKIQVIKEPLIYTFEIFYKESDCKTRQFYFLNAGQFQRTESLMNYQFEAIYINLSDLKIVDSFNRQSMCEQSQWKQNKNKNITAKWCLFFSPTKKSLIPNKGDWRYGIYKIDKDKLFFGKLDNAHNALTPQARPVEFDLRFYQKISPAGKDLALKRKDNC